MANTTTDHETIRNWVHERGGVPATVESTADSDEGIGILRIDFPHGGRNDTLSTISWENFFDKFEESNLAFLHEDKTAGGELSRFCKFIDREKEQRRPTHALSTSLYSSLARPAFNNTLSMAISIDESALETPDGRELHCRRSGPSSAELVFVVVHGLGEHSGCYDDFVDRMLALDRGVVIYDQHGHGQSPGARGDAPSFDTLVDDIAVALEFAAKQFPRAELVLLGHSMGGNLVLNHLLGRDHEYVKRAIVTNPMILPPNPPTRPQAFAAWLTGKLIPHIRLSASIEPTQLTQDTEALRDLAEDDLIHEKLSIGIGSQLVNHGIWLTDHAKELNVKLLVLTGAEDELCDSETTDEFVENAGRLCHRVSFDGLRHSLLIEDERDQVYDAIENWLLDTAALSIEQIAVPTKHQRWRDDPSTAGFAKTVAKPTCVWTT